MRVLTLEARSAADKATVRRLQFAPDGRRFAAVLGPAGVPHAVIGCDLATGQTTWQVTADWELVAGPAIDHELSTIAWVEFNQTACQCHVWQAHVFEGKEYYRHAVLQAADVSAVAFHPSDRCMAVAVYFAEAEGTFMPVGRALLTQYDGYGRRVALPCLPTEAVAAVAWSPGGDRLAAASESGGLWVVGRRGGKPISARRQLRLSSVPAPSPLSTINALGWSPDGRRLLALDGRTLAIWDFGRGEWLGPLPAKPRVLDAAYSPDGRTLAIARRDGTVTFLDADTLSPRTTYDWKLGPLYSVAFAPDGLTCAAGGTRRRVVVWDLE